MPRMVQGSCGHQIAVDDNFQGSAAMCGYCNQMVGIGGAGPAQSGAAAMGGYAATAGYAPGYAGASARPGKGMAVAGGVLTIIIGALAAIGGILFLVGGSMLGGGALGELRDMAFVIGLVFLLIGGLIIVSGSFTCTGRPGWVLASAIIMAVFSVLGLIGVVSGGGGIPGLLLTGLAATFCFLGYPQAKRVQAWKQAGGR